MNISDLPEYYECEEFELIVNDNKVWINNATGLIGRFSPRGIDIHTGGECIACKTGEADFEKFVELMKEHHQIDLSTLTKRQPPIGWVERLRREGLL